ncbi:hypothetical protein EBT23_04040 [bacterium]|nr:hypothetical protein [bacterium]
MTTIPDPLLKIGYNLLFTAGFALTWPYFTYLIWRRQPFWERLGERLGHYPREIKEWLKKPERPVWIHAVSVGEVLLARVLVRELRRHRPNLRVFLTVGTPTGRRVAEPLLDEKTCVSYVPTDFYYSMMRAFRRVRPKALILVENEIWPNMLWRAKKMGIPVCLVNSRLSRRNRRLFRAARTFVRPVLQAFDWIGVQSEEDLGRFAIALASDNPGKGREIRRFAGWDRGQVVLLGGSTHPGEEKALADVLRELKSKHPNLRLMLVPRHVERKGEILQELSATGLKVGLRSRLEQETGADPDILLVDSTGELRDLYPACELVFIGKTAIVAGPHMDNFQSLRREFLAAKAIVVSADARALGTELDGLLVSPAERDELGRRALSCFREHLGAGARHVEALLKFLNGRV